MSPPRQPKDELLSNCADSQLAVNGRSRFLSLLGFSAQDHTKVAWLPQMCLPPGSGQLGGAGWALPPAAWDLAGLSVGLGREDSGVSVLGLAERVGQGAWSPRMPRLLSVCLRRKLTTAIDY